MTLMLILVKSKRSISSAFRGLVAVFAVAVMSIALHQAYGEWSAPDRSDDFSEAPFPTPIQVAYQQAGNVLWCIRAGAIIAIALSFSITRASARLWNAACRVGRRAVLAKGAYLCGLGFVFSVPHVCVNFYERYFVSLTLDFKNQEAASVLGDVMLESALELILFWFFSCLFLILAQMFPRMWWVALSAVVGLCAMGGSYALPIVQRVEWQPLNSLDEPALKTAIHQTMRNASSNSIEFYVIDGTAALEAVSLGFHNTRTIALSQSLLSLMDPDATRFIVAHEIGHHVGEHLIKEIAMSVLVLGLALLFAKQTSECIIRRLPQRMRPVGLLDVRTIPIMVFTLAMFYVTVGLPVENYFSRYQEREADRFAIELLRDTVPARRAIVTLARHSIDNPQSGWFYDTWRATQPVPSKRIRWLVGMNEGI